MGGMTARIFRRAPLAGHPAHGDIRVDPLVAEAATLPADALLARLGSASGGLATAEAARRLAAHGGNEMPAARADGPGARLWRAVRNPLVLLLLALAAVSLATGDVRAATVIGVMVVLGVALRFVQEARASAAAAALTALVRVTTCITRDGVPRELPVREVVPGDILTLQAGDMIPADLRLLDARGLHVGEASLTGESLPVEKTAAVPALLQSPLQGPLQSPVLLFRGTSVQSGSATAVAVATGPATYLGQMIGSLEAPEPPNEFQRGIDRFTWLMIRLVLVMAPLVFVLNGARRHDWPGAFFFAVAVAVGLTPEMLPMVFSVCLSQGAVAMARRRVIVKHLDAIQGVGAIDVLCTDKTGTLTRDAIILERHCDVQGTERAPVVALARLVSRFQTGLASALDAAILAHGDDPGLPAPAWRKVDEIPFDFTRRLMSVVVEAPGEGRWLVAKGAVEELLAQCVTVLVDGAPVPLDDAWRAAAHARYATMSGDGFRVLAVARRPVPTQARYTPVDEVGMELAGFLGFLDPPKESAAPALQALRDAGVRPVILTGDNEQVTARVCAQVGVPVAGLLTGAQVEALDDARLAAAAEGTAVFARLTPGHKERIIRALQARGHVVGFLGDGINDAPALHTADVGISVDSAVDIAKDAADVILLDKDLRVLEDGVRQGRTTFANILKYVRMGASSNFGNMLSVVGASAWLPFLPMAPIQVLTNNLLYDLSQLPIPGDRVDPDQLAKPRPWSLPALRRYILVFGPLSSLFDYATFAALFFLFGFDAPAHRAAFQTGWFVESLCTQALVIHVIRTERIPFLQSRPSAGVLAASVAVVAIGVWLPASPLGPSLGFVPLPAGYWPLLAAIVLGYLVLTQLAKGWLRRRALL